MRTCAQHGVAPLPYLTDVLRKLADDWPKSRLEELLPDRWQQLHGAASGARDHVRLRTPSRRSRSWSEDRRPCGRRFLRPDPHSSRTYRARRHGCHGMTGGLRRSEPATRDPRVGSRTSGSPDGDGGNGTRGTPPCSSGLDVPRRSPWPLQGFGYPASLRPGAPACPVEGGRIQPE